MKVCNSCHVQVQGSGEFCPLCGKPLEALQPQNVKTRVVAHNSYPNLMGRIVKYNLLLRVFLFLSFLGAAISVLVNLLVTPGFLWCLIVVACLGYAWLTIPPMLRRRRNFAALTVLQTVFTSGLVIALDGITGYKGWSVSYVVPSLLLAGILAISIVIVVNRTNWAQYVLYQVLMGVFGLVPLLLYLVGAAHNLPMVIITAACAIASLLTTFLFGDRSIKSEFKRRFHF